MANETFWNICSLSVESQSGPLSFFPSSFHLSLGIDPHLDAGTSGGEMERRKERKKNGGYNPLFPGLSVFPFLLSFHFGGSFNLAARVWVCLCKASAIDRRMDGRMNEWMNGRSYKDIYIYILSLLLSFFFFSLTIWRPEYSLALYIGLDSSSSSKSRPL